MTHNLLLRRGTADDFEHILAMIDEAAGWLRDKGTDQWSKPWPTRAARDERVRRGLREGATWVVEDDGAVIATMTYRSTGNLKLWTVQERREPAVYVSRLIVRRSHAGLGIGEDLVDWAGLRASRDWGAQWIRIDVWTTNTALHNYYEKRGFRAHRIHHVPEHKNGGNGQHKSYPSAALFQKPTAEANPEVMHRFVVAQGSPEAASPAGPRDLGQKMLW